MVERFLMPILLVTGIAILVWIVFWKIFSAIKIRQGVTISIRAKMTLFLFYVYLIAVLSVTIIPLPFKRFKTQNEDGINVIPIINTVKDMLQIISTKPSHETVYIEHNLQNLFGNIILFMPLGMFLPLLSNRYRSVSKVFIIALICSVSIELTQLILRQFEIYRYVDIDDVILNTTGAVLGYGIIDRIYHKD